MNVSHVRADWFGVQVRPEVIEQHIPGKGPAVDILLGVDPGHRPDDNTLYLPEGYPEAFGVRLHLHDAERLHRVLGDKLRQIRAGIEHPTKRMENAR